MGGRLCGAGREGSARACSGAQPGWDPALGPKDHAGAMAEGPEEVPGLGRAGRLPEPRPRSGSSGWGLRCFSLSLSGRTSLGPLLEAETKGRMPGRRAGWQEVTSMTHVPDQLGLLHVGLSSFEDI